jgi:deoxyadenosine/deoxycytidine kinase
MEATVEVQYLDSLQRAYNQFFFHYDESPLLIVETSDVDMRLDEDFDLLVDAIKRATHGTNHFVPRSRAS